MRKNFSTILIVGAALLLASCVQQKESFSPVDYVNPLMGTESTYAFHMGILILRWRFPGNEFLESADRRER